MEVFFSDENLELVHQRHPVWSEQKCVGGRFKKRRSFTLSWSHEEKTRVGGLCQLPDRFGALLCSRLASVQEEQAELELARHSEEQEKLQNWRRKRLVVAGGATGAA